MVPGIFIEKIGLGRANSETNTFELDVILLTFKESSMEN